MKRLALVLAATTVLGVALPARAADVSIQDNSFQPSEVTIEPGDEVTWTNEGGSIHTVTADDGSFDSGDLTPGADFSRTFDTAGDFPYYCTYHGGTGGAGMSGTVRVQTASTSTPTPPDTPTTSTTPKTTETKNASTTPKTQTQGAGLAGTAAPLAPGVAGIASLLAGIVIRRATRVTARRRF